MKAKISGVRIKSICSVVPKLTSKFVDEMKEFPFSERSSLKLAKVMGFREHRIADPKTTLVDLAAYGINCLLVNNIIKTEDISAIVFVAQQNDHPVPGNSKIIHGMLDFPKSVHCVDMYENCTGFISGLYVACSMIASSDLDNVLVIASNSGACYGNKKDRNIYPLCGDAAGVAVVSKSDKAEDTFYFDFHHDGSQRDTLLVPAGGMRMPATAETAKLVEDEMGNFRSLNQLHMDGTAVFHFVMESIPPIIDELCQFAGVSKNEIEYYLTHQPNRFMLEKLADLLKVPREILFNNIVENFGNSSCATIPVDIAFNLGDDLEHNSHKVCMAAFGAGMSVASAICHIGNMDFCKIVEHPCNGSNDFILKGE